MRARIFLVVLLTFLDTGCGGSKPSSPTSSTPATCSVCECRCARGSFQQPLNFACNQAGCALGTGKFGCGEFSGIINGRTAIGNFVSAATVPGACSN